MIQQENPLVLSHGIPHLPTHLPAPVYGLMPVPVNRGEEIILKVLEDNYKQEQEKYPESKHKYIIVVPNESVLETMPELEIPHLFAIVKELSSSQMDYESKNLVDIDYYEG